MDFDDLDDLDDAPNMADGGLTQDLRSILEDLGISDLLSQYLEDEGLSSCLKFYECVNSAEDLDQRITSKLSGGASKRIAIRNAWRRCEEFASVEREAEKVAEQEREEREREAELRRQEEELRRQAELEALMAKLELETKQQQMQDRRRMLDVSLQQSNAKARCEAEFTKPIPKWQFISLEQVMAKHAEVAPGMFYKLEFPWNEDMLVDWGPDWLTKAFHTAGTLDKSNRVTKIIPEKKLKVTTGNNGAKFLFEVEYAIEDPNLHTRLFAKVPHPMNKTYQSDRLSTSVHKQPMEFEELNTSRLLEATLPVKLPKYYFADISNETSNFILIVERIDFQDGIESLDFGEPSAKNLEKLPPYAIEGPYDKCIDWTLRGNASEYYYLLVKTGAKLGGLYKAGKMGDVNILNEHFENWALNPMDSWGMHPGCTGKLPKNFKIELDLAYRFMSNDASVLFPAYVGKAPFENKFKNTMMLLNAYCAESTWWRNRNPDYIALNHNNLNVDNAFWWRDENGQLDLGVFDWGHMSAKSIGYKLWPWLYCGDHDVLTANLDGYMDCLMETYHEYGGPKLDKEELRMQFVLSAFEQLFGLISAVPQIYRMCPKKEWPTIKSRWDPRIAKNVDGKSTLRLYLHVMESIVRIMEEWDGASMITRWVDKTCEELKATPKPESVIWGT